MGTALSALSSAIQSGLQRHQQRTDGVELSAFNGLRLASEDLAKRYDQAEKAFVPPKEKRQEAVNKFKAEQKLDSSEWRLVFAGLSDREDKVIAVLDDEPLFARVHREVDSRIERKALNRRDWLALCYSYFAYEGHIPGDNENWCLLRSDIERGFSMIKQCASREKEWMRIVEHHRTLFGEQAGVQLAEEIFAGRATDLSALQAIAQVPESSWLWQRIFSVLLSRIFMLDDDAFLQKLPELVALGQINTRYLNQVLSACLTRYHQSRLREQSSSLLKQAALDHWGSPQIRSKQNAWLQYVSEPVCAMVVAWFAKEDLEHFFTLLKGGADVDQSRLFYWLRFANQMSYTRIVMGSDAWHDQTSDFVQFRQKNKGRLSQLTGGPGHNNAVIMQIGNYFFVEFSGTGNACYVYKADSSPFNPDKKTLALASELKQQGRELKRMRHSPAPRRANLVEGWLEKFDAELRTLGITPHSSATPASAQAASAEANIADQLAVLLEHVKYDVVDNRSNGGALKVVLVRVDARAEIALKRLGFKPLNNNPLAFWRP